jgi:hypothetical protein
MALLVGCAILLNILFWSPLLSTLAAAPTDSPKAAIHQNHLPSHTASLRASTSGVDANAISLMPVVDPAQLDRTVATIIAIPLLLLALTMASVVCIARRRTRSYVVAVAILQCLAIPVGTIIGGLSLMVLTRPSVKELFEPTAKAV